MSGLNHFNLSMNDGSGDGDTDAETVIPGLNLPCLDAFRNPSSVKMSSISLFRSPSKEASTSDVAIQLIYYAMKIADQFTISEFRYKKLPILTSAGKYTKAYEEATLVRLQSVNARLRSAGVEQLELHARKEKLMNMEVELNAEIEELKGNVVSVDRLERLRDLNQNSDRVTTKLYEERRELRECEKLQDDLHDRIRD